MLTTLQHAPPRDVNGLGYQAPPRRGLILNRTPRLDKHSVPCILATVVANDNGTPRSTDLGQRTPRPRGSFFLRSREALVPPGRGKNPSGTAARRPSRSHTPVTGGPRQGSRRPPAQSKRRPAPWPRPSGGSAGNSKAQRYRGRGRGRWSRVATPVAGCGLPIGT